MPIELVVLIEILVLAFLGYIFMHIRRSTLAVKQALVWFFLAVAIAAAAPNVPTLERIAHLIGIQTASNMMFFFGILFSLLLGFMHARALSTQQQHICRLTQEIGLLHEQLSQMKSSLR